MTRRTRDGRRSTGRRRCPSSPTSTRTLDSSVPGLVRGSASPSHQEPRARPSSMEVNQPTPASGQLEGTLKLVVDLHEPGFLYGIREGSRGDPGPERAKVSGEVRGRLRPDRSLAVRPVRQKGGLMADRGVSTDPHRSADSVGPLLRAPRPFSPALDVEKSSDTSTASLALEFCEYGAGRLPSGLYLRDALVAVMLKT
jgi:hypothetical protein